MGELGLQFTSDSPSWLSLGSRGASLTDGRRGPGEQEAKLGDAQGAGGRPSLLRLQAPGVAETVGTQLQAGLWETLEVRGGEGPQVPRLLEPRFQSQI